MTTQQRTNMRDLSVFLETLYQHVPEDTYIGLTTIKKATKRVENYTYKATELARVAHNVETRTDKYNIFVRVPPLKSRPQSGLRGTADQSVGSAVLWQDIDTLDKQETIRILEALEQPPTTTIDSGNGIHAYWSLQTFETDLDKIESKNCGLMQQINQLAGNTNADSVFDLARVMRVPGSWNVKNGAPKLVSILSHHPERVYRIDQFPTGVVNHSISAIETWDTEELPLDFIDRLHDLDKKLAARILTESGARKAAAHSKPDGSVDSSRNDAYIATRLFAMGYSAGVILSVLSHDEWFSGKRYQTTLRFDYVARTVQNAWEHYQQSPDRFFRGRSFQPDAVAATIDGDHPFIYTASNLWLYRDGVFHEDGEEVVKKAVIKQLGSKWSSYLQGETLQWLQAQYTTPIEQINQHGGLINCQNGMLDIASRQIKPHDESYRSLAQIPVTYNENADTTAIDAFVSQLLPADALPVFWEFVGSAFITNHYWPKKFALVLGPRDTGKSKLIELLLRFYGRLNCETIDFQTLADQRFAKINLFGKMANICDDLSENEAQNTGNIKTYTGDGYISAERKYGDFVSFKNTARLFFAANHHVPVRNPDDAYFSRVLVFPCLNQFSGSAADHKIVDKLSTPENLSAMLLRALQGLRRLLSQNQLSASPTMEAALNEYRFGADTVLGFFQASTEMSAEGRMLKDGLYQHYKNWCTAGSRRYFSSDKFFKRITEYSVLLNITETYATIDGERKHCFIGRKLLKEVTTPVFVFSRN